MTVSNLSVTGHVALAGVALLTSYAVPYSMAYVVNLENVKAYFISANQAEASTKSKITPLKAREVTLLTANFIYETRGYDYDSKVQEDAFRYIATSVINKKNFEGKKDFAALILEKQGGVCQYSWVCEKGKPTDLKLLQKQDPEKFSTALQMASDMVDGTFKPIPNFDGIYYVREDVYNGGKTKAETWHRRQVEAGKACKRRTIDSHVYIAPKKAGTSCKQNQLAFY